MRASRYGGSILGSVTLRADAFHVVTDIFAISLSIGALWASSRPPQGELTYGYHRFELAKVTGMDWKEVDRQLRVLENYGLAHVIAQSGTVKMYQITEQSRVLVKLIGDLANEEKAQQTY